MVNYSLSKRGSLCLCLAMICDSLKNGEDIENDTLLSNALYFLEDKGISLDFLKSQIITTTKRKFNKEEMMHDAQVMSLKELSLKWQRSEQAIRDYCYRNNIPYKKSGKRIDLIALKQELISYNGEFTIDQMVKKTHHEYNFIKGFCDNNKIAYRTRVC